MARKSRLHYLGACYHVILRGNSGNKIFFDKKDRSRFFFLLQEGTERYRHRIHAYCLMTNYVHLVIQVGDIALSRIIQNVSFRYTLYVNHRKKQAGHLFQGRYKALLIDADCYLLELVLAQFAKQKEKAITLYQNFITDGNVAGALGLA